MAVIGQVFTLSMIILGGILLYQHFCTGPRRPAVRSGVQRAGVKRFAHRPKRPPQRVVSWPTALAYYTAYWSAQIDRVRADWIKGWRAGRAVFVMSHPDGVAPPTAPIAPPADAERERELELDREQGPERSDIIVPQTKELTVTQRDRLLAKFKPLVDQDLLTPTDIAVLMYGRTDDRRKQIVNLFDTPAEQGSTIEQKAA
jgi:hypothetical protein